MSGEIEERGEERGRYHLPTYATPTLEERTARLPETGTMGHRLAVASMPHFKATYGFQEYDQLGLSMERHCPRPGSALRSTSCARLHRYDLATGSLVRDHVLSASSPARTSGDWTLLSLSPLPLQRGKAQTRPTNR